MRSKVPACSHSLFSTLLLLVHFFGVSLHGEVTLPAIFGDHMVVQKGTTFPVWGKASPDEIVTVMIGGQSAQTRAAADGRWRVILKPLAASADTKTLVVQGNNRIQFHDVVIGDVWICAGDENMDFPLSDAVGGKAPNGEPGDQYLRFFLSEKNRALQPDWQGSGHWVICSPEDVPGFSAVGYFFARDLRSTRQLPIGMIQCTGSNSPVQAWISHEGVRASPSLLGGTRKTSLPDQSKPSELFNGLIFPLIPYAMTGVIWYQGESEEGADALQYRRLFPRLIRDWRKQWGEGLFSFLFVQAAGFGDEEGPVVESFMGDNHQPREALPWLREGQSCALILPNTGMADATDLGIPDERQSPDKLDVGRRLARLARKSVYGEEIESSGPTLHAMKIEGGKIGLKFDHARSGLTLGTSPFLSGDDGPMLSARLTGFALSGGDNKWFPANGVIKGETVLLSSDAVPHPLAVRYNWKGFPNGNLYNREGLPAPPFRTDNDQPN